MTTMTPKNIMAKVVYGIAAVPAVLGLIFFIPGGLLIIAAFLLGCGADKMERVPFDPEEDTTIEDYERAIDKSYATKGVWNREDDSDAKN